MFGRRKGGKDSGPNRLRGQTEPNKLSWSAGDAAADEPEIEDELEDEELDDEELDDEELDDDEEVEAEYAEDDEPDDEEEEEIARRQLELQAELSRQAEEFGLTNLDVTAVYGENGPEVVRVLDELEAIEAPDAEALADAWLARDESERDIVERDISRKFRSGSHRYEISAGEDAVTTWLSRRMSDEPEDAELWRVVAQAARGAVIGLILDQELDDVDYDTLYGAWGEVMDTEPEPEETAAKSGGKTAAKSGAKGAGQGSAGARGSGKPSKGSAGAKSAKSAKSANDDEELDPEEFGPNTELVRAFFVKLGALDKRDLEELVAAWKSQDRHDLKQAHDEVRRLVKEDDAWRDQVRAAQDMITQWVERFGDGGGISPNAAMAGGASAIAVAAADLAGHGAAARKRMEMEQLLQAKRDAVPAAVDAVTALVLADLLEPEDAETLFGPWTDAIGEPELPEFESDEE